MDRQVLTHHFGNQLIEGHDTALRLATTEYFATPHIQCGT
jgi:hypothetical protein